MFALAQLEPFVGERDDEGRWVVGALHAWGKNITHSREPASAGGEFLMHPEDVAALRFGDCDDLLRAQAGMALALGLPVAALVWDYGDGGGHVSTVVGIHSYADMPVLVVDRLLPGAVALAEFSGIHGSFAGMASFKVVSYETH